MKNNIQIEIEKGYYNKTQTKDGVIHEIVNQDYPYYMVHIYKRYLDIDNKEELKRQLREDLKELELALENEKEEKDIGE